METSQLTDTSLHHRRTVLLFLAALLPLFSGYVHLFDWDEINFAEIAREMNVTGNYATVKLNYQPFWEKPPLFFWLQALCMKMFGINEFSARFPNAIVGWSYMLFLLYLGRRFFRQQDAGFVWVLLFFGSILPFFYFKSGIIDPLFNLFIYCSVLQLYYYSQSPKLRQMCFAALFAGLAFLTKGPVGVLLIALTAFTFLAFMRFRIRIVWWHVLSFMAILILLAGLWILPELNQGGGAELFRAFLAYQIRLLTTSEAGHGQPFFYHFVVLFIGCFPMIHLAIPLLLKRRKTSGPPVHDQSFTLLNQVLFWVVLLIFSITTTKIIHYSSLCYLPLSYLAIRYLVNLKESGYSMPRWQVRILLSFGIVFGIAVLCLPLFVYYRELLIPMIRDPFAVASMRLQVNWSGWEILIGVVYLIALIFIFRGFKTRLSRILVLGGANIMLLMSCLVFILPKIERHVQGPYIDFLKAHSKGELIWTYQFKSYAQYYYADVRPPADPRRNDETWLLTGAIDRPVYIVSKVQKTNEVLDFYPNVRFLYTKGGFSFFVRVPQLR